LIEIPIGTSAAQSVDITALMRNAHSSQLATNVPPVHSSGP
jgi:hypothetical protein